ncbi:hypothetical protein VIC_001253 [Vibrio coralliilyticus ATCC BAA-450]|nr:hypothetical protein VIC_001253 [Vibrio coralliilyticus ATCC BAA-450]
MNSVHFHAKKPQYKEALFWKSLSAYSAIKIQGLGSVAKPLSECDQSQQLQPFARY